MIESILDMFNGFGVPRDIPLLIGIVLFVAFILVGLWATLKNHDEDYKRKRKEYDSWSLNDLISWRNWKMAQHPLFYSDSALDASIQNKMLQDIESRKKVKDVMS